MCVIVAMPANKTLPKQVLQNCYENNPDGWGIMAAEGGRLHIEKGLGNFDVFYKTFKGFSKGQDRAIHFRWKTHGLIDEANCHPFPVTDNLAFMHNGILSTPCENPNFSDTWHFAEKEVKPLAEAIVDPLGEDGFIELIEGDTKGSKMLFMDSAGKTRLTFPEQWHNDLGCAFSNSHSMEDSRKWKWADEKEIMGGYDDNFFNTLPYKATSMFQWCDLEYMTEEDILKLCQEDAEGAAAVIAKLYWG